MGESIQVYIKTTFIFYSASGIPQNFTGENRLTDDQCRAAISDLPNAPYLNVDRIREMVNNGLSRQADTQFNGQHQRSQIRLLSAVSRLPNAIIWFRLLMILCHILQLSQHHGIEHRTI